MNPYDCSRLARTIYEERVREGLARNAARKGEVARGNRSERASTQATGRPRIQAAVRWLVAGLFLD
jgi:hypothetical protein